MFDNHKNITNILSMLTGKLLGDGCITKQNNRKPRFQFIHSYSDRDWCFHCYDKLKDKIPLNLPYYKKVKDSRMKKGYTECLQVQSKTDPLITYLELIWYKNRKKQIPFCLLENYFNDVSLAWWYQDDGSLTKVGNIPKKIILSTNNFTTNENIQLIDFLSKKYLLNFHLDTQNRLILYDQPQIYYFLQIVEPHIHSSMSRKTVSLNDKQISHKRTSIYLPATIHLRKPTEEINMILSFLSTFCKIILEKKKYIEFYRSNIAHILLPKETNSYQIVIKEEFIDPLQFIKNQTGLSLSHIITICFEQNCRETKK